MRRLCAGTLIVSCQADETSPFNAPEFIAAFAQAALLGGASALRLEGAANVAHVRRRVDCPIIGLIKHALRGPESVYITPMLRDVAQLVEAGADIIAFDATARDRPVPLCDLISAIHASSKLAMADISTVHEAEAALRAGADYVGTTLSGYTTYTLQRPKPDLDLIAALTALGVRPIAEGNIRTPTEAREALRCGAYAVVVGSAITRPEVITRWFTEALAQAKDASPAAQLVAGE
jgi:N-acylglucosamine-6-phosphate 2-epimerase